jgi:organic hydroperoxide reductase OsmC/OhrA
MKVEPVKYSYKTSLLWTDNKKGILKCEGKPDIVVACPPEFGGHPGIWSPEDLFLASVEVCTMTSFLWLANKEKLKIINYKSNANGIVEMINGGLKFNTVFINIIVEILYERDKEIVKKIIKKLNNICLISKSIIADVVINFKIKKN